MSKVGKRWTDQENAQLAKLYNEDLLDINEIAKIHKRNPLGIAARLVTLKIINHILDARGHPNPELNSIRQNSVNHTPVVRDTILHNPRDIFTQDLPILHDPRDNANFLKCSECSTRKLEVDKLTAENSKLQQENVDLQRRIYGMCTEIRSMNGSKTADERKNPILKNPIQPMKMTNI